MQCPPTSPRSEWRIGLESSGHCKGLVGQLSGIGCWRQLTQGFLWSFFVVFLSPPFDLDTGMHQADEPVFVQAFVPKPSDVPLSFAPIFFRRLPTSDARASIFHHVCVVLNLSTHLWVNLGSVTLTLRCEVGNLFRQLLLAFPIRLLTNLHKPIYEKSVEYLLRRSNN